MLHDNAYSELVFDGKTAEAFCGFRELRRWEWEHHSQNRVTYSPIRRRIPASGAVIKKADAMTSTRETTAIATCVEMFS